MRIFTVIECKKPRNVLRGFHPLPGPKNLFSFDADKFTVFRAFNFNFTLPSALANRVWSRPQPTLRQRGIWYHVDER